MAASVLARKVVRGWVLEKGYFLRRKREELAMAQSSASAVAKLIHFDLAGRYSVKARGAPADEGLRL